MARGKLDKHDEHFNGDNAVWRVILAISVIVALFILISTAE